MKSQPTPLKTSNRLLSDAEYIQGLKANDEEIVHNFFYEFCNYIINDIRVSVMQGILEYDELVSELYIYLSKDGWHKLDTFQGINGCHLRSWLARLCWRFFLQRREILLGQPSDENVDVAIVKDAEADSFDIEVWMDVESTFSAMSNTKYVMVLRMLLREGYSPEEVARALGTTVSNIYNIKHRAILQFVQTYCERD